MSAWRGIFIALICGRTEFVTALTRSLQHHPDSVLGVTISEFRCDSQNESTRRWSELTPARYGPVPLTFSGLGSSRSTPIATTAEASGRDAFVSTESSNLLHPAHPVLLSKKSA